MLGRMLGLCFSRRRGGCNRRLLSILSEPDLFRLLRSSGIRSQLGASLLLRLAEDQVGIALCVATSPGGLLHRYWNGCSIVAAKCKCDASGGKRHAFRQLQVVVWRQWLLAPHRPLPHSRLHPTPQQRLLLPRLRFECRPLLSAQPTPASRQCPRLLKARLSHTTHNAPTEPAQSCGA